MAKIKWRPEAVQDIDRLIAFLNSKDPNIASQGARVIYSSAKRLEKLPGIGRPLLDDTSRRELVIPFGAGAYVIRYVLENDGIYILRVWHSKESRTI